MKNLYFQNNSHLSFQLCKGRTKWKIFRHICKFCSQHSQLSSWLQLPTAAAITASTIHNLLQADWRAWLLNILLSKTMRVITEQSGFIWRTQWTRINLAGFWPFLSQTRFALWDSGSDLYERNIFLTILTLLFWFALDSSTFVKTPYRWTLDSVHWTLDSYLLRRSSYFIVE